MTPRRPLADAQLNTPFPQGVPADSQLLRCFALFKVEKCFYVALCYPIPFRLPRFLCVTRNKSKSVQALAKRQDSGLFPSVAQSVSHSAKRTFPATLSSFRSLASLLELTLRSPAAPREVLVELLRSRFPVEAFLTASDLPCSCVLRKDDGSSCGVSKARTFLLGARGSETPWGLTSSPSTSSLSILPAPRATTRCQVAGSTAATAS